METLVPKRQLLALLWNWKLRGVQKFAHEVAERDLSMHLMNSSAGSLIHGAPSGAKRWLVSIPFSPVFESLGFCCCLLFLFVVVFGGGFVSRGQTADYSVSLCALLSQEHQPP